MTESRPSQIQVCYKLLRSREAHFVHVPRDSTVSEFLSIVQAAHPSYRFGCDVLWSNGSEVSANDRITDWLQADPHFVVAESGRQVPPRVWQRLFDCDLPGLSSSISLTDSLTASFRLEPGPLEFVLYSNVSGHSLLAGTLITVDPKQDLSAVRRVVSEHIRTEISIPFELHLYLSGGVPFLGGPIQDWLNAAPVSERHIYAVVTRPLGALASAPIAEVCDCSTSERRLLLSPLVDSTPAGCAQLACVLGYFAHDGVRSEHLIRVLAKVTRFAPLVVALNRLTTHLPVTGADVCAASAALHCLFATFSSDPVSAESLLEHTFDYFAMLAIIDADPLQLYVSGVSAETPISYYCGAQGISLPVILWEADLSGDSFDGSDIAEQSPEEIAELVAPVAYFKPLSPTALRFVCSASLMVGPRLFLGHEAPSVFRFVDPAVGRVQEERLDRLAAAADGLPRDAAVRELENARFDQIIDVCIDESLSMGNRLDGRSLRGGIPRMHYAREYLTAFLARVERSRVSTIFGLVGFSDVVDERAPLSPLASRFDAAVAVLEPHRPGTRLWDAIDASRARIVAFDAGAYRNALQRIIVISDGEDSASDATGADVANRVIADGIVVDAVIVGTERSANRELAALCAASGGVCAQPPPERAAEFFEAEAFANLHTRERPPPPEEISPEEFARRSRTARIAKDANCCPNAAVAALRRLEPLGMPAVYFAWEAETRFTEVRSVRLFAELREAVQANEAELKVLPTYETIDRWVAFVSGPAGTPYERLWWALAVAFPAQYPMLPPVLRFASVPWHPNVAREGRVFFSKIEVKYCASAKIVDILGAVRRLLAEPEIEGAVERTAAEEWTRDRAAFERKARAGSVSPEFPAKSDYREFPWQIYDEDSL